MSAMMATMLLLLGLLTCSCSATAQAHPGTPACIHIEHVSVASTDGSGNTDAPVRLIVRAHGPPDDLKRGEIVYSEDGVERAAITVGDLKTGEQTLSIPAGLHTQSASRTLSFMVMRPDGTGAIGGSLGMLEPGYRPRAEHKRRKRRAQKRTPDSHVADSGQEIAWSETGIDAEEAISVLQFGADEIGVVSSHGMVSLTTGDDAHQPPQKLTIRGVNLKDGMLVRFQTEKGGQQIEARSPLKSTRAVAKLKMVPGENYTPDNPSTLYESVVEVPIAITHAVTKQVWVRTSHGDSRQPCSPNNASAPVQSQ